MMLKQLLVLLCGVASIAAAVVFHAPWWVLVSALAVFFIGLMWIAVRDANANGSGQNYCGGGC
jgi:hypothetical protein